MQFGNGLALMSDQTVIRVGQRAVGLKAHGLTGSQQLGKSRVFAKAKAPAQCIGHEPVNGHGAQPFAFEL